MPAEIGTDKKGKFLKIDEASSDFLSFLKWLAQRERLKDKIGVEKVSKEKGNKIHIRLLHGQEEDYESAVEFINMVN